MTYLGSMLDQNIYDNIVHEHVAYYSLQSLEFLLEKVGLYVHDAKIVKSYGGSLRVFIKTEKPKKFSESYKNIAQKELSEGVNTVEALSSFNNRISLIKIITQDLIKYILNKKSTIWAFGASTKGNMICQFNNIDFNQIPVVLDNNEKKIGLMMTGSEIPVVEEAKFIDNLPEYLLMLPYYYLEFFTKLIRKRLVKGQHIHLLVPLPHPRFVTITK
jgi:hypothetical protein